MERVKLTGVETGSLPVLSNQEMRQLFKKMHKGDTEARSEIITGNLKLVLSVLKKFKDADFPIDDLFQIGCIGLTKAVDNFDLERGVKFSTYAVPMIMGEIKRYIRDNKELQVSRSLRKLAYKALKLKEQLEEKKKEEPTLEEIAAKMDVSREKIVQALEATKNPISLFKPVFESEGDNLLLLDQLGEGVEHSWIEKIDLRQALDCLSAREQLTIKEKFYEGKTQSEIAEMVGVSQAQISRIQNKALNKLKQSVIEEGRRCAE